MLAQGKQTNTEMIVLARINPTGIVQLEQSGMLMLNNFMIGQMLIICLSEFSQNGYKGMQYITGSKVSSKTTQNCLLISPLPILDPKTQKNIFFAESTANNEVARQKLHILASLISSVVVIRSNGNLNYLTSLGKKVIKQFAQRNSFRQANTLNSASLIALTPISSNSNDFIVDATDKFIQLLQSNSIYNEVKKSHQDIKGLQCSEQSLKEPTMPFKQKFLQQLDFASQIHRDNNQLMYGPILAKYLQNLALQLNNTSNQTINLQSAQDDIIIDQGYEAYISGIRVYHQTTLSLVNKNSRPDDNQLQQMLDVGKSKAIQQFYGRGGSASNEYRKMLEDYIFHKSREVNQNYSKEQWNRNLQILESESKLVLDKINSNKNTDHVMISKYIQDMNEAYNKNARGIQKYQIWNDYMKVFTPIAFEKDFEKQNQYREQLKKNQELRKRLSSLEKKNTGGFCGSCSIM